MGSNIRIELNSAGVVELLKSPEVLDDLERRAGAIAAAASAAGGDFEYDSSIGATRARASVWTADHTAMRAEATNRTLTSSLDAGR